MSKHLSRIALAAIVLSPIALAAASAPAAASPTLNFAIHTSQFSKPTMEFEYDGGKYVWKQQAINTQFSASANTNHNDLVWIGALTVQTLGVGGSAMFTGNVPTEVKSWSQKGPIQFPVNFLSVYQAGFASYCEANGVVGKPIVNENLSILYSVWQAYDEKQRRFGEVEEFEGGGMYDGPRATKNINMPMTVVCLPKPSREVARPGGVKQETPDFKVKSIALNYGGAQPTKVNPTTVCKSAKLSVVLHTSKAGVVDVKLHKKVGAGPIQAKSMQLFSKFDGNAHFVASYVEYVKVSQPTLVQAMAEEFNSPLGQTTGWKDVTLHCENANGGYAGTPNNSNSGEFPQGMPKRPKVPGPGGKTAGSTPTHAPFKPVIAPATPKKPVQIKTAPVPQRDTRLIGIGVQRVQ